MTFPADVSYIQAGRDIEVESAEGGRRSSLLTMAPPSFDPDEVDDEGVALTPLDDIIEPDEWNATLDQYLPYAEMAFAQRSLPYPFRRSDHGDSLNIVPERQALAHRCAVLARMVGKGNAGDRLAKDFERRSVQALHRLVGGWGACVGHPRDRKTGPKRAVRDFRGSIPDEVGDYRAPRYQRSGDMGLMPSGSWVGIGVVPSSISRPRTPLSRFETSRASSAGFPMSSWIGSASGSINTARSFASMPSTPS